MQVSIALSLDDADAGCMPEFRDTFAYLPCCHPGLRLMVNAGGAGMSCSNYVTVCKMFF